MFSKHIEISLFQQNPNFWSSFHGPTFDKNKFMTTVHNTTFELPNVTIQQNIPLTFKNRGRRQAMLSLI